MTPNLMLMMLLRVVVFGIGLFVVVATLISAIKTFVVPRGLNVRLTSAIFWLVSAVFRMRNKRAKSYHERDQTMALFAPVTLIVLPIAFLTLILLGYAAMYWALELMPLSEAMRLSGSSLLTLGYASVEKPTIKFLEFSEAMLGLVLVALLVAYLPTMYAAFSRRETAVALLEGYAGAPPSAAEFLSRMGRNQELENLRGFWETWQIWFAELEESHTSLAPRLLQDSPCQILSHDHSLFPAAPPSATALPKQR